MASIALELTLAAASFHIPFAVPFASSLKEYAMLEDNIKNQLKSYLERLQQPIELVASLDDSEKSIELRGLLREIATLSPLVSQREDGNDARKPSFSVGRPGEAARIRFAGLPMGHEFTSLVLALLQVSGYPPKVEAATIGQIKAISGQYRFETYISLSCHNCPDVVQALNLLAMLNPGIESVMIDGALFQSEVNERKIMAVPTVFLNGEVFGQGRMTLEEIIAKLDTGAAAREAEKLNTKAAFDVLVVGGGPAGAAAAIYAARKGIRTGVLAERFGGQVLDTMAIENLVSVPKTDGPKLAMALEQHVKEYEVDIMNLQQADALAPAGEDGLFQVHTANGATLKAKTVILATGARWREMNIPGEKEYKAKGVCFCPHCDGPLFKGKRVAVIGGGNSGVEAAIDLAGIVSHVTLLEFATSLRADAVLQAKLSSLPNVTVITNALTSEVHGDGEKVTGITYQDRASNEKHLLGLEGIFVQIGLLPNTDWLKGTLALSPRGEIEVDARGQTSIPGVFAAGDASTTPYKQIIIAMGEGAKASLSAFDHLIRTPVAAAKASPLQQAAA
jgi:alkyl hydroperoxide reductase subunit F